MDNAQTKSRKPWLAGFLSLIATGLGQVYNGEWKKGVVYFLIESAAAMGFILAFRHFGVMVAGIAILVVFNFYVVGEAVVSARSKREYVLQPCNRKWVYILLLSLNMVLGITSDTILSTYFFQSYKISSGSMLPTYQLGDHFIVEKFGSTAEVNRGEVIVFEFPEDVSKDFVKRVIGMPGDTFEIKEKSVYINGQLVEEPFVQHTKYTNEPIRDDFGPLSLGPDEYFVMGDNREASYDSRWWGPVKRDAILGRVMYIYFPGNLGAEDWWDRLGTNP